MMMMTTMTLKNRSLISGFIHSFIHLFTGLFAYFSVVVVLEKSQLPLLSGQMSHIAHTHTQNANYLSLVKHEYQLVL